VNRVTIGVHVHAEPARLLGTLSALSANTTGEYDLLLLPDGPDPDVVAALEALHDIPQSATAQPKGAAACFNRLVSATHSQRVVLLESGSIPGPRWLDFLLAALDADARNGLAGPSTNLSWNEQALGGRYGDSLHGVSATAGRVAARFANETRTLEPLHSLADFCYAVRRDVVSVVGAADEGYGSGPCWEMDYNIRAARAGFRGVWACGAYVHRMPFTARRRAEEARRFDASRQRYQDKFCALRLRGESLAYEPHCRGDACEHFAPPALIRIFEPLLEQRATGAVPAASVPAVSAPIAPALIPPAPPLVTCIMPTNNRRGFVPQAVRYFLRQDYPSAELLVVDDGTDAIGDCLPADPRIRYIRLDRRRSLGAKRNLACAEAAGEYVMHWDDDDWYPVSRIRRQMAALADAEICGTGSVYYYDASRDRAWRYRFQDRRRPWVSGNTLAYRKRCWEANRFAEVEIGEDSRFLWSGGSKKVHDLDDPALCVGMIHAANASPKETGSALWVNEPAVRIHELLGDDLSFYRGGSSPGVRQAEPLISCIMPTCDRRPFISLALRHFRAQDYSNKELVIVDDGRDAIGDIVEGQPDVRYVRLNAHASIGRKRNTACQHARGEIIAHWDDDDWYGPGRLRYQAGPILAGEADLTGLQNAFVLDARHEAVWTTSAALHRRMFVGDVHGGTLMFRKAFWEGGLAYPEIDLAEDAMLLRRAVSNGKRLMRLPNPGVFVYVRHGRNAWRFEAGAFMDANGWSRVDPPAALAPDLLEAYRSAAAGLA